MAKGNALGTAVNLARHVKAIVEIVRAALAGGWVGAAVAVVKNYLPQILAFVVGLLLLPIVIFVCLPALLFSTDFSDPSQMEELLDSYYGNYKSLTDDEFANATSDFWDNLYSGDYGENTTVVINGKTVTSGEIMDMNWLIAIHSVSNMNELPTKESVKDFTKNLFSASVSEKITNRVESNVTNESGDAKTQVTLHIDRTLYLTYIDPYSLMNKLDFNQEQIVWAETMYSVISGVEPNSNYDIGLISDADFINPLPIAWRGTVTSEFGFRYDPISGDPSNHTGIDFAAPYGTDIRAVKDGTVVSVVHGETDYGYFVKISHGNGLETMYAHCSKTLVSVGDEVKQGDVIAKVGSTGKSTGNHLHFEVRINGRAVNPRPFLP